MAWWDFIKALKDNNEEERKRRDNQGGLTDRVYSFIDSTLDKGREAKAKVDQTGAGQFINAIDETRKDLVGAGAGLIRESIVKPVATLVQTAAEAGDKQSYDTQKKLVEDFKKLPYERRKQLVEMSNDPNSTDPEAGAGLVIRRALERSGGELDPTDFNLDKTLIAEQERIKKNREGGIQDTLGVDKDSAASKLILGNEPVQSYTRRYEGLKGGSGLQNEANLGTVPAAALTVAGIAADFIPGGDDAVKTVGRQGVKELTEAGTEQAVKEVLKGKFSDDAIKEIAPVIAKTNERSIIEDLLNSAKPSLQDRVKSGKTAEEILQEGVARNKSKVEQLVDAAAPPKPVNIDDGKSAFEEILGRMSTSEEIKNSQPKKKATQRLYEGLFDKNAPLDTFSKVYKESTGMDLPASQDPAALRQLASGIDDATKQQLSPTLTTLGGLEKGQLDAVKVYGESRQILNKADLYDPAIVDRARKAVSYIESSLPPEQLSNIQQATQAVSNHHDALLRMLVDSGDLSETAYQVIKEANPNFFSKRNLVEYITSGDNRAIFSSKSSNVSRDKILKAVKGIEDDSRYQILDPIESMVNTTRSVLTRVNNSRMFDAAKRFTDIDPELVKSLRNAEDVQTRFDLSYDNRQMRGVRNKLDSFIKRQGRDIRRLQSEIERLNKKGLDLSLSKDTQKVESPILSGTRDIVKNPRTIEGKTTQPLLSANPLTGTVETQQFSRSLTSKETRKLVEDLIYQPNSEIQKIKKMIGNRDSKLSQLLDELSVLKGEYDDTVNVIRNNSDEMAKIKDADVPEGYMAISRIRNGITERLAVPKEIGEAWAGLSEPQRDFAGKFMKKFGTTLRASVTTLSLPFQFIRNPIRDARQTMFTSQAIPIGEYITVLPYMKRWTAALKEAMVDGDFAQQIRAAGGGGAGMFHDYNDSVDVVKQLQRKVDGPEIKDAKSFYAEVKRVLGSLYGRVEKAGAALEYAPRLAEAKAVYNKTGDISEAARSARNVTVDFERFGREGRILNDYFLFLNARLQGNKNVISAIKRDPKRAAIAITANIAAPAIALYAWNRGQYGDVYDQIDQDTKDSNFILILGREQDENGKFTQVLKIPKNEADKVFSNITEEVANSLTGNKTKGATRVAAETAAAALPFDTMKDGSFNASRAFGSSIGSNPVVKIPAEYATNKNFYFDSPIVTGEMENLPPEMQKTDRTSKVAEFVSSALPGEQSPMKIDNAIRSTSGTLLTKDPLSSTRDSVTGASDSAPTTEFYKVYTKASERRASASKYINDAIERGDYAEARKTAEAYNNGLKSAFTPWVEQYGRYASQDLNDKYQELKINLTSANIKRRRSALDKSAK